MSEIDIRIIGAAGRITLKRPKALNALTYDMARAIEAALDDWRDDARVALIVIDAEGDKAFCAGGDIADLYRTGMAGDFGFGQQFWRDEYRLNAKLAEYPKPIVSFMQGFTMGGGVGVGCHASHRVVGTSSQIAMPECGIGLVPDVGGSLLLARAPGHLGAYLGLTASRMGPGQAIQAGFADHFLPEADWPALIARLEDSGDSALLSAACTPAPTGGFGDIMAEVDRHFAKASLGNVLTSLEAAGSAFAAATLKSMARNSPLSMACALEIQRRLRDTSIIREALDLEYRFTFRAMQTGDFLEGIRAAIIDKDRLPKWRHGLRTVPAEAVQSMLAPLGENALHWEEIP